MQLCKDQSYQDVLAIAKRDMATSNYNSADLVASKAVLSTKYKIDDPLWRHICKDVSKLLGSMTSSLKDCKLGDVIQGAQVVEIYNCPPEACTLLKEFDFVVLPILQKYFPSVRVLRIENCHN